MASFANRDRAIADRQLLKTLTIGLCASLLAHTTALAGMSYWMQNQADEDLEITTIERVNIDPEPKPTPTPAVTKPIPTPVKPKIAAAPKPQPIKEPPPKPIATPPPTVKITKSAVVPKPSIDPFANFVQPTVKQTRLTTPVKTPPQAAIKPDPAPKFPDRLFSDPAPKPSKPAQPQSQKTTVARPSKPVAPTQPKVATQPQDLPDPTPDFQEPDPKPPGNPDKIAKAPNPIPNNANQTNLGSGTKTRQNWANDPNPPANDAPANNDDFGSGTPGNNQKIASSPNIAPANSSNQTGLAGGTSKNNRIGANFDGIGGEMNSSNDESIVGTPGNSSRIARSQSGGNGVGQNQASLSGGGGKKRTTSLGGDSNGSGAGIGNNDEFSVGAPGNIAAAGKPQAASIQCLRNCEIKYPDTLADADMGKDKILVKVTIDPGGSVTAAQIARSSGNSQLDRVTLDGIKQMQLTAMGKAMTFKVKVSTLTN